MKKLLMIITVIGLGFIGYTYASTPASGDSQGGIHIEVVDQEGTIIISDYYDFEEETSLFDILQENYEIGCADASYEMDYTCEYTAWNNHIILGVESVETDWWNSFLEITVDDVKSQYGADSIMLIDETTYRLTYTSLGGGE